MQLQVDELKSMLGQKKFELEGVQSELRKCQGVVQMKEAQIKTAK